MAGRSESVATLVDSSNVGYGDASNGNDADIITDLSRQLEASKYRVNKLEDENIDLRAALAVATDKNQSLEKQLETLSAVLTSNGNNHQTATDLQHMYSQIRTKDTRIIELNNFILEKERQIMDLQEACREQGEIASAKSKAVQIVNQRLQEFDSRLTKDASTETDAVQNRSNGIRQTSGRSNRTRTSPGRAVPQLRLGTSGSPPPLDPAEDASSITTETATYDDPENESHDQRRWSQSPIAAAALHRLNKKYRKRVTFNLKPGNGDKTVKREVFSPDNLPMHGVDAELAQQIVDLTNENDELRRIIAEIERAPAPEQMLRMEQLEEELNNVRRDAKNEVLRGRATTQAQLKEQEERLAAIQAAHHHEVESLKATNETLKNGRDFVLNDNGKLLYEVEKLKTKESDLRSELDGSVKLSLAYRRELDTELRRAHELRGELKQALHAASLALDEKQVAYAEIQRLKDALFAQEEFVKILEGDLIVYETRVGLLRESLGQAMASERELAREKADNAKVNAFDVEKEEVIRERNDDKLVIKALRVKVQCLEQERDELVRKLNQQRIANRGSVESFEAGPPLARRSNSNLSVSSSGRQSIQTVTAVAAASPALIPEASVANFQQHSSPTLSHVSVAQASDARPSAELLESLTQQLEQANSVNAALQAELDAAKAKQLNETNTAPSFMSLLRVVEDISTVTPLTSQPEQHDGDDEEELAGLLSPEVQAVETLRSLESENLHLREANTGLNRDLASVRDKVAQMEVFAGNVETVKDRLEQERASIEEECEQLRTKLIERENELANAKAQGEVSASSSADWHTEINRLKGENSALVDAKDELLRNIHNSETLLADVIEQKRLIEGRLTDLERQNNSLNESNERLLRFEQENNRLDELVNKMRMEVEQFRVEAELSRRCLEDLRRMIDRANSNGNSLHLAGLPRNTSIDEVNAMRTALEALRTEEAASSVATTPGAAEVRAVFYSPNAPPPAAESETVPQQVVAPSAPSESTETTMHNNVHDEFYASGPVEATATIFQNITYPQQNQAYPIYQEEPLIENQMLYNAPTPITIDAEALERELASVKTAYSDLQHHFTRREDCLANEKTELEQRITVLTEQLRDVETRLEDSLNENVQLQNNFFAASERAASSASIAKQLEDVKSRLIRTDKELESLLREKENLVNEFNELQDKNSRVTHFYNEAQASLSDAEQTRNMLAAENRDLRENVSNLQKAIDDLYAQSEARRSREADFEAEAGQLRERNQILEGQLASAENGINDNTETLMNSTLAAVDPEFDVSARSLNNAEVQCELLDDAILAKVSQQPLLNEWLKNYVTEANNFNEFLAQDVASLFTLNEELATAADCLKGQVWALNQQLKKSVLERHEYQTKVEQLESFNATVAAENARLKQELDASQVALAGLSAEQDRWTADMKELQDRKADVDQAYSVLSDKYAQLQTAYESVSARLNVPKANGSTDPMISSSEIDAANQAQAALERVGEQMRAELEARAQQIRALETQLSNAVIASTESTSLTSDDQARGEKATAHWTMVEIKKLLIEAADTLQRLPIDEAYDYVRRETEVRCQGEVRQAAEYCEKLIAEMQRCEEAAIACNLEVTEPVSTSEANENSAGINSFILKLFNWWRTKHNQLLESASTLESQQQLCRELETRLSDANERIAEFESRSRCSSETPSVMSEAVERAMSPSMLEFWNRVVESFSQSCRATHEVDLRLSSTNGLITQALAQLDSSSNTASSAMISAKLQTAILAARLTAKQADNDALFRATTELANTNVELQNQVDELNDKLSTASPMTSVAGSIADVTPEVLAEEAVVSPTLVEEVPEAVVTPVPVAETVVEADITAKETSKKIVAKKVVKLPPSVVVESVASTVTLVKTPKKTSIALKRAALGENEPISDVDTKESFMSALSHLPRSETIAPEALPSESKKDDDWGWGDDAQATEAVSDGTTDSNTAADGDAWGWGDDKQVEAEPVVAVETKAKRALVLKQKVVKKTPTPEPSLPADDIVEDGGEEEAAAAWAWGDDEPTTTATASTEWGWDEEGESANNDDTEDQSAVEAPTLFVAQKSTTKKSTNVKKQETTSSDWGWGEGESEW